MTTLTNTLDNLTVPFSHATAVLHANLPGKSNCLLYVPVISCGTAGDQRNQAALQAAAES